MKILYSVQATGNGHISRAMEVLPWMKQYGQVDLFLSGANSSLELNEPVKFRSKGLSFFYAANGGLHYGDTIRKFSPIRILKEVKELPVEKYDLVINDFESITAMACAYKNIPSINFGHQASFGSAKVPRPEHKSALGEWILRNYARASRYLGLHFAAYDDFILPPVIKDEFINADVVNDGHITVYLPSFSDEKIGAALSRLPDFRFQVFSKETKVQTHRGNVLYIPVSKSAFNRSLISCSGIITNAGFETPAEALYLKKKLLVIPIKGQYEQACNAAALREFGIPVLYDLDEQFTSAVENWNSSRIAGICLAVHSTENIVQTLMATCKEIRRAETQHLPSNLLWT